MPKNKMFWSLRAFDLEAQGLTIKSYNKKSGAFADSLLTLRRFDKTYRATWIDYRGHQVELLCSVWLETLCLKARGILEGAEIHNEFLFYNHFGDPSDFIESYGEIRIWSRTKYTVFDGAKHIRIRGIKTPPSQSQLEQRLTIQPQRVTIRMDSSN